MINCICQIVLHCQHSSLWLTAFPLRALVDEGEVCVGALHLSLIALPLHYRVKLVESMPELAAAEAEAASHSEK